jgi:hypothetical protein
MKSRDQKLAPFVPLLKETLDSRAWKAASHGSRSLYVALKRRYNYKLCNNGRIYLSQRAAAEEIGSSANQITRWFRELQHFRLIVMTSPGGLGLHGKGRAPHWRLTECGYMRDAPTRDFLKWNGDPFKPEQVPKKSKSRSGKRRHLVAENGDPSVAENGDTSSSKCSGKQGHELRAGVAENRCISSLPLVGAAGRSETAPGQPTREAA